MEKAKLGCKTYLVEMTGGGVWKRHVDQMMKDQGSVLPERKTTELDPEKEITREGWEKKKKEMSGGEIQMRERRCVQQAPIEEVKPPTLDIQPETKPVIPQDSKQAFEPMIPQDPPLKLEQLKTRSPEEPHGVTTRSG